MNTNTQEFADELNAKLQTARVPLWCKPGPRALQWVAMYAFQPAKEHGVSGYHVSRGEAMRTMSAFGLTI